MTWWKDRTGYQIYPRSFQDSNGDGIGDLRGIIDRLDHLVDLGIGFIWLSPVYSSPMADNGYDISDYRNIAPEFGTLGDMDRLIAEADKRDIRIVMDLVVNHTSDQHPWFQEASASSQAEKRDWYLWRAPVNGGPPDDRRSYFGGPAWRYSAATEMYYLALFTPEQPDLNWNNADLRAEIWDMMRWWLDRGIGGFRMDVIDHIGKDVDAGIITDGPRLHDHLQEMHREVLAGRDALAVGEAWSATTDTALLYTGRDRGELDMMFQFAHITALWDDGHGKWRPKRFDLTAIKRVWTDWQIALQDDGWNALFWANHDLPRAVSRYGDEGAYRVRSAKALALVLHLMKGTPFVYQGEEIGMTNTRFDRIEDFRDIEVLNHYAEALAAGTAAQDFIAGANANGRDGGRTPVLWDDAPGAGFTTGTPWIGINANYKDINVAVDHADPNGVFAFYRQLIALRRGDGLIVHGRFAPFLDDHPQLWAYTREQAGEQLSVIANISGTEASSPVPPGLQVTGQPVLSSMAPRGSIGTKITLAPWEAFAVRGPLPGPSPTLPAK
ncbi:alpha-glucosidase [Anianabacter salinae]|uniref:alpha-glucosidase n=1 Tax=Anianabacter salinae TaxID=2851023 RepID=UPI00225DDF06|nr:alpha-glucosidase [Anianabacter salinae]MBV0911579.1 alpha-glucosidase [Anianabacter salinae]